MVQAVSGLRAAFCAHGGVAVAGCSGNRRGCSARETGGGIARPSVEELGGPSTENRDQKEAPKSADAGRNDTREAMCLMIESAARANDLPLEFSPA